MSEPNLFTLLALPAGPSGRWMSFAACPGRSAVLPDSEYKS